MHNIHEKSTRSTVLHLLKLHGSLSVNELATRLEITEMAVRRHIQTLERDGYIQAELTRQAMGRPANRYFLTSAAEHLFPKNYHVLALDLLDELVEEDGVSVKTLFERRKQKLVRKYAQHMMDKPLAERVAMLAEIQNDGGYMVEWEEGEDGFILHEYNCPISEVAHRYNQACHCELELFQTLLDTKVERTECLAKGGGRCTYQIERKL